MLDASDLIDIELDAQSTVDEWIAEFETEWEMPVLELMVALNAATLPRDAWRYVPPEQREQLREVYHASKTTR